MELRLKYDGGTMSWELDSFTDVQDRFVFMDSDGDGRLMVSKEELQELAVTPGRNGSHAGMEGSE